MLVFSEDSIASLWIGKGSLFFLAVMYTGTSVTTEDFKGDWQIDNFTRSRYEIMNPNMPA